MTQSIGIYSGTFDPLHKGHIAFAKVSLAQLGLDFVVFLPEPKPRGKVGVTPLDERLAALRFQLASESNLTVVEMPQDQFTVHQTLPALKNMYPGAKLSLLVGSDVAWNVNNWPDFGILKKDLPLIIGLRSDCDSASLKNHLNELSVGYQIITADYADVSSSQFR